ncbi:unnamed protein product [Rhizophagus irregularis]|nr:unnamed protein product [Rhizophagus irregularis]
MIDLEIAERFDIGIRGPFRVRQINTPFGHTWKLRFKKDDIIETNQLSNESGALNRKYHDNTAKYKGILIFMYCEDPQPQKTCRLVHRTRVPPNLKFLH